MFVRSAFLILCAAFAAPSAHAAQAPAVPVHRSLGPVQTGACMKNALVSHAAYVPGDETLRQCSHLLSTDTLLTIRRWDRS